MGDFDSLAARFDADPGRIRRIDVDALVLRSPVPGPHLLLKYVDGS